MLNLGWFSCHVLAVPNREMDAFHLLRWNESTQNAVNEWMACFFVVNFEWIIIIGTIVLEIARWLMKSETKPIAVCGCSGSTWLDSATNRISNLEFQISNFEF